MTPALPMPGGCNCGQVRYRLNAYPLTCYICHCHLCQKRTGSAFSMQLVLPGESLEIVAGEPMAVERVLASGQKQTSHICPSCWSRISTRREGAPYVILRAGTLDDTAWLRPVAQMWTSSAQPWAVIGGEFLSYAEQPADFGPMVVSWGAREETS
jgi:hypothetical protein